MFNIESLLSKNRSIEKLSDLGTCTRPNVFPEANSNLDTNRVPSCSRTNNKKVSKFPDIPELKHELDVDHQVESPQRKETGEN